MNNYRPRVIDSVVNLNLQSMGAILIEGAKWCGKTSTAEQHAKSVVYMTDPQRTKQYLTYVDMAPEILLNGTIPRLIDEWQIAPKLWDHIRFQVDHRPEKGQYILTGSAVPVSLDDVFHSGIGRIARITMRPMSLWESGDSNGTVSLQELFQVPDILAAENNTNFQRIAFLTCRGGWPGSIFLSDELALNTAKQYFNGLIHSDIQRVDSVVRDVERVRSLMRSYARMQGSQASVAEIVKDMSSHNGAALEERSVNSYINALEKIFVIEDMPAWNPNLRSKTAIRTSHTHYFVDPSIATEALGIGPDDLINDLETFGFIFETLCIRDLRVYADVLDGNVYHYRDKTGLECDAVLHLRNGKYGLIEIKLGGDHAIETGASTLKKLASKIDDTRMKSPSFLMVLTAASPFAYRREDGVYVVPIGCLKN